MENSDSFCPYVGLEPYDEAQRDYFFGRVQDTRRIVSNLYGSTSTVLFGASGVGKSSVLRAGVTPQLRAKPRTAVIVFGTWQSPFFLDALKQECIKIVQALLPETLKIESTLPLDKLLQTLSHELKGTIFLLFDQFEEYFLYHTEEEGEEGFEADLARAANTDDIGASFLFVMREDAFAKLDRFGARIPYLLTHILRLRHLNKEQATEAIRKPLDIYNAQYPERNVTIEDELVTAILNQVQTGRVRLGQGGTATASLQQTGIETPFLQIVLTRLWEEEMHAGSSTLRLGTFKSLGEAEKIIKQHLDDTMNTLTTTQKEVAAGSLNYLVTPDGTKIAHTSSSLAYYAQLPMEQVQKTLIALASPNLRVLRTVPAASTESEVRFEIFHDILAPAILDWRARYYRRSVPSRRLNVATGVLFPILFLLQFLPFDPLVLGVLRGVAYSLLSIATINIVYRWFLRYISLSEIPLAISSTARQLAIPLGLILALYFYTATDWSIYNLVNPLGQIPPEKYIQFLLIIMPIVVTSLIVFVVLWGVGLLTKKWAKNFAIGFYSAYVFMCLLFLVLSFLDLFMVLEPLISI